MGGHRTGELASRIDFSRLDEENKSFFRLGAGCERKEVSISRIVFCFHASQ